MFKKILFSGFVFTMSSHITFAECTPYLGGGLAIGSHSGINIFGGYGNKFKQNYYLGGELFLNNLSYSQSNHINYGLGGSILPGIFLNNNTMAYTRFGIGAFRSGSSYATKAAGQLGLGLQTSVAKKWDIRGEYVYTSNISTNQFNLGLLYKFK